MRTKVWYLCLAPYYSYIGSTLSGNISTFLFEYEETTVLTLPDSGTAVRSPYEGLATYAILKNSRFTSIDLTFIGVHIVIVSYSS